MKKNFDANGDMVENPEALLIHVGGKKEKIMLY
jgi:hypothetical protein